MLSDNFFPAAATVCRKACWLLLALFVHCCLSCSVGSLPRVTADTGASPSILEYLLAAIWRHTQNISLSLWNESDRCNGFQREGLTSDASLEKQSKPKLNCRIHFILKNKKNVAFWWNLCQYGVGATWELQVACVAAVTASCFKGLLMLTWSEIRRRSHLDLSFPPHQIYWLPTITPGYPSSGESGFNWHGSAF